MRTPRMFGYEPINEFRREHGSQARRSTFRSGRLRLEAASRTIGQGVAAGSLWLVALGPAAAVAQQRPIPDNQAKQQEAQTEAKASNSSSAASRAQHSIGSISVGHAHDGRLINGVRMPEGEGWIVGMPDHAYGTEETIESLVHCIEQVRRRFEDTPKAIIGSISAKNGGRLSPHKSHQSGRDVDFHFYLTKRTPKRWYEPATADNLDRARSWAMVRCLVTESDVDMILIDQSVKALLEEYALGHGEPAEWIRALFHGQGSSLPLIKHVPGHTGHMHIRFVSPVARERGRRAYDLLVAQGHIELGTKELVHTVVPGDTLIALARRYEVAVEEIRQLNGMKSDTILVGAKLKIRERVDLRGAREPVIVPPRSLPPRDSSQPELVAGARAGDATDREPRAP